MKLDTDDYFDVKEEFRLYFIKVLKSNLCFCAGTAFQYPIRLRKCLPQCLDKMMCPLLDARKLLYLLFTIPSTQEIAIAVLTAAPFAQRAVNYARTCISSSSPSRKHRLLFISDNFLMDMSSCPSLCLFLSSDV